MPRLVEVVQGDVHDPSTLPAARDRDAARVFGLAARDAGVKRIVYLGGLGAAGSGLSDHLRSRQETGEALRSSGVPVTEFRAAVIVGSGSISFEMIRWLVERLPVMICPRWVFQRIQPVAISDVLSYLLAAPSVPGAADRVVEIGGADVLTYRDDSARRLFPAIHPLTYGEALDRALEKLERGEVETAYFAPRGLAGHLYWYLLYPVHAAIFGNLVRRVAERGRALAGNLLPRGTP